MEPTVRGRVNVGGCLQLDDANANNNDNYFYCSLPARHPPPPSANRLCCHDANRPKGTCARALGERVLYKQTIHVAGPHPPTPATANSISNDEAKRHLLMGGVSCSLALHQTHQTTTIPLRWHLVRGRSSTPPTNGSRTASSGSYTYTRCHSQNVEQCSSVDGARASAPVACASPRTTPVKTAANNSSPRGG